LCRQRYHRWSETFDRQLDDVFKIQDEIASAVVKALKNIEDDPRYKAVLRKMNLPE
jgi:hypothetical protein